ncbi:MAG: VOC family protein [Bacteroidota bacterium]
MKVRIARHTNDMQPIQHFYCDVLGLQQLGNFEGHNGYDGIFLGRPGLGWHLEFTTSQEAPVHKPDEDDLLVLYADSPVHYHQILERFTNHNIPPVASKNPYWNNIATTYIDPDGYRVVISLPAPPL